MYFLVKYESAPKRGYVYGVSLSSAQRETPEVQGIIKGQQRRLRNYFIVLMLFPLPALFIPWFSIFMVVYMIWLIGGIFIFFVPFAKANVRLKELKREKGWNVSQPEGVMTEIKLAGKVRRVKFSQFLLPCIISIFSFVLCLFEFREERLEALYVSVGSIAFLTPLFYLAAVWMDRQKTEVISMDSEVNLNYTRAKKNLWKNFWVEGAYLTAAYTAIMVAGFTWRLPGFDVVIWSSIAYTLLLFAAVFFLIKKKNRLDKAYSDKRDVLMSDEDDNWIWGLVYYNKKDKHALVEKRFGTGSSINMATPLGKGLVGFVFLTLLSLPFICLWLILLEFTPIQLRVENSQLIASQIRDDYTIYTVSVRDAELIEELPKWEKISGTAIDGLRKGTFRIPNEGRCEVFLNPDNQYFIRFEVAGVTYYMSGADDEETLSVYEALTE